MTCGVGVVTNTYIHTVITRAESGSSETSSGFQRQKLFISLQTHTDTSHCCLNCSLLEYSERNARKMHNIGYVLLYTCIHHVFLFTDFANQLQTLLSSSLPGITEINEGWVTLPMILKDTPPVL